MSEDDMEFFQRRAIEEYERATAATDMCAHKVHERIAAEYELIAQGAEQPILRAAAE
jgi:hypothetical protein